MADKPQTRSQYRNSQAKQPETQKTTGKGRRITGNIFKIVFFTALFMAFSGIAVGASVFYSYAKDAPKLTDSKLRDPLSSKILDKDGKVYAEIGKERREYIEYKDIPKQLENAVLSTEDSRFYEHNGIDPIRLVSAAAGNVTGGFGSQGASTLSQQIIKMSYLDYTNKTLKRKAQEAWMAVQLEQKYSKQELLEIYINKVYLSDGIHGMETAAEHYYGKKLKDLNLAQTALIAGMPQSPNRFNPFENPDLAKKRRDIVLTLMYNNDKISKSDMEAAQSVAIADGLVDETKRKEKTYAYDTYVDQVIDEIGDKYDPFTDGLTIYTALDPDAQKYTEKMLNTDEIISYPDAKFQAGVVVMDTETGRVQALGGGRDTGTKKVSRGLNRATDIKRQPGSTMKPILGYAPAIEYLDWSTAHILDDSPYQYSSGQELRNYDSGYLGDISMRRALYLSRNIPAVKASKEVGYERARDFANNLGLNYKEVYESTVIGSGEASPIQMAGAYATFGNGGVYNKPHTVTKILLSDGETEINMEPESVVAMKASTAYMISDMLKDVLTQGTGTRANIPGWNIAAKTGTTNYDESIRLKNGIPSNGTPDSWFVGYSPRYTVSIWNGYDEPNKNYLTPSDTRIAAYMFKSMMEHLVSGEKNPDFKKPSNVNEIPIIIGSNPITRAASGASGSNVSYELFLDGTIPTRSAAEKKTTDTKKEDEKTDEEKTAAEKAKKEAEEKAKKDKDAAEETKKQQEEAAKKAAEEAEQTALQSPAGLNGSYNATSKTVSANWASNGPGVTYDVTVNGQTQNYGTTSITVSGGSPGSSVVIIVVPVKDGKRGSPASTTITIPAEQTPETTPPAGSTDDGASTPPAT
ncbi:penicillin-binding protein [Listeria weihenstephanensis FSL R9-0317]|uniref:Penicillin-binding protein n=1 Tax=Listeria weihenstephanensis TaxID=1006155 RepID=A0A1S7FTW8_9LIST|nr:PBP1A family penicillin-binding protein [Listeria weihenstephanensis]AQY50819.1 penicillin-binding protein [Listeria weihenstephanensis]EUJ35174.1 penicillin-binding protein [Listeria weihenstephanensis FSL R9-0317]MBC1501948.1 PBP1A family penicillin-binding protein [Listeria weihenstephanensis]